MKAWLSERVHCELRKADGATIGSSSTLTTRNAQSLMQSFLSFVTSIVDAFIIKPSTNPTTTVAFNRTVTVSAFSGPGCLEPMPVTAMNLKPEL